MKDVVVIGGGIAGLTAAYRLQESGADVVLVEAQPRIGGMIRSETTAGYLLEYGPNSIQSRTPILDRLIAELRLESQKVEASEAARVRYIVKGGRPVAAPASPAGLFSSSLFGAGAKLRVMREPFIPPADPRNEESVADFIRRRLGSAFLDYGMDPFVAGVYAGNPATLSVKHAFPSLVEMEQKHGSIIRGQIEKRRDAATAAVTRRMFSFRNGIGTLTDVLASRLRDVRVGHRAEELVRTDGGWKIRSSNDTLESRAVVYTAPLHALPHMSAPDGADMQVLTGVAYPPLSVVYLGFMRDHVAHPLDGFGMLVPAVEREFRILGTLFTSSIFPDRAPGGHVLVTTFVGGMRHPDLGAGDPEELLKVVRRDLDHLLGFRGAPAFEHVHQWKRSIPQYRLGYGEVIERIEALEESWPGWFMAGNYRNGVSVGEAAASGDDAARRCITHLNLNG